MQVVNPELISNKRVLLRYDIDVALHPLEDFKLKAGLETLKLCLEHGSKVILIGHVGRPEGKVVENLRVAPIVEWFKSQGFSADLESGKLEILENLRFDPREEACDEGYAKKILKQVQDDRNDSNMFYINEAFSAYRPAVSTTILPTLLPHAAGLQFAEEVRILREVRDNPKKPCIAIMGGAKVKDKLPVITQLAKKADVVLVGGKLIHEIKEQQLELPANIMVGKLTDDGFDIAQETISSWSSLILKAAQIIWNGPLGKFEDLKYDATKKIAQAILDSKAEIVIGGGDSVAALSQAGLFEKAVKVAFVSVGGGAMLKLLSDGTLPTIEALS